MAFLDKTTEIIDVLQDKIADLKDRALENKKITILVLSLVLLILLCIILLFALAPKKEAAPVQDEIVITQELMVPRGPSSPDTFKLSRNTKDKWTVPEIEPYFTTPSGKEIEDLEKANNKVVKNILEAAP